MTHTQHTRWDSSGRIVGSSQIPVPDETQPSQEIDIHSAGGIRTRNAGKRTLADSRIIPRGH